MEKAMIENVTCENRHKMVIDWELGRIEDHVCWNKATKYIVDDYGIFYLCDECYKDDCKRRINNCLTMKDKDD
tara:strand:+ start:385 stop:603 length:219 start_codon:yes stop_codon:yes gene_type:complete